MNRPRPITREEYTAINAVNFSTLRLLLRSPEHYKDAITNPEPEDPSRFAVGTLAHAMVLEGKDLRSFYAIKPTGMSFATKEGKAWRDAQTLPILKEEEADGIPRMAQRIVDDRDCFDRISSCQNREECITFQYEGIQFKCLLDMWGGDGEFCYLGDYKTTPDCRQDAFAKKVDLLDYDLQIALYSEALKSCGYEEITPFWIAQEKQRPYTVKLWKPSAEFLDRGARKLRYCVDLLTQCLATNSWPGYGGRTDVLHVPGYTKPIQWGEHLTEV